MHLLLTLPFFSQMMKFALVGISNTLIDFFIYFLLTRTFLFWQKYYLGANFASFFVACTWSFFINKNWTFKNKEEKISSQYPKFFIVSVVGLIFTEGTLFLLVEYFDFYDLLAKIAAVIVVFFWNFSVNKFWTFKNH